MKRELLFTAIDQDIYILDHSTIPDELRDEMILLKDGHEHLYFYIDPKMSDALWLNILHLEDLSHFDEHEFIEALSLLWFYFDQTSHIRVDQLPKHELTVYPGSFSPWHDGHSACVNKAREHGKVLVIPDKNPEKLLVSENYPLRRYILLCRHIKAATQVGPLFIYPGFIIASKKNPTYFWIEKIKHSFPDIKITLLLGFDSFKSLPKWIEAENLIKMIDRVFVVSRAESQAELELCISNLLKKNSELKIEHLGHHRFERISSSSIRKKAK